jgi:hypothetical protein
MPIWLHFMALAAGTGRGLTGVTGLDLEDYICWSFALCATRQTRQPTTYHLPSMHLPAMQASQLLGHALSAYRYRHLRLLTRPLFPRPAGATATSGADPVSYTPDIPSSLQTLMDHGAPPAEHEVQATAPHSLAVGITDLPREQKTGMPASPAKLVWTSPLCPTTSGLNNSGGGSIAGGAEVHAAAIAAAACPSVMTLLALDKLPVGRGSEDVLFQNAQSQR